MVNTSLLSTAFHARRWIEIPGVRSVDGTKTRTFNATRRERQLHMQVISSESTVTSSTLLQEKRQVQGVAGRRKTNTWRRDVGEVRERIGPANGLDGIGQGTPEMMRSSFEACVALPTAHP